MQVRKTPRKVSSARKTAAKNKKSNANLKTGLWMAFFPVGITLMWRRSCTWPKAVKYAVTGLIMAIVISIISLPAPASKLSGGITLVGNNPEVEVYGPELPATIIPGYTNNSTASIIVASDGTASDIEYVYAADGASCYHEYECKFAYASSQRLTVYEAYYLGFTPCGRCNPPAYAS